MDNKIPVPLISVIAEVLSSYYTHTDIESRFFTAGFLPPVPDGNKQKKCQTWLLNANQDNAANPLKMAGSLIEELMEVVPSASGGSDSPIETHRNRINAQLKALGLSYKAGGHILRFGTSVASRGLQQIVHERDLQGVNHEFERILKNLETDPAATLTASCSLLEALFKTYIADENLSLPADQSILPLWKVVRAHLRLDPGEMEDDGLKKILSGLASVVDGTASLRTKHGSAHGHDNRTRFKIEPRHARLASHAAFALATFFIEVAEAKKSR